MFGSVVVRLDVWHSARCVRLEMESCSGFLRRFECGLRGSSTDGIREGSPATVATCRQLPVSGVQLHPCKFGE